MVVVMAFKLLGLRRWRTSVKWMLYLIRVDRHAISLSVIGETQPQHLDAQPLDHFLVSFFEMLIRCTLSSSHFSSSLSLSIGISSSIVHIHRVFLHFFHSISKHSTVFYGIEFQIRNKLIVWKMYSIWKGFWLSKQV